MLPKKSRIKNKKDFDKIFKKGRTHKDGQLVLKAAANETGCNRFAFMVSQKISKKAVDRNKLRRRLAAIAGKSAQSAGSGKDIIFIALPGLEKKNFSEIKKIVETLLKKCLKP